MHLAKCSVSPVSLIGIFHDHPFWLWRHAMTLTYNDYEENYRWNGPHQHLKKFA